EVGPGRLDVIPIRSGLRHEVVVTDLLGDCCLVCLLSIALSLLLPPDGPPVGELRWLTRDRRLRISICSPVPLFPCSSRWGLARVSRHTRDTRANLSVIAGREGVAGLVGPVDALMP